MSPIDRPPRFWIFDQPRTCSQLFFKLFSQHPQLGPIFHPLIFATALGSERIQQRLRHCEKAEVIQKRDHESYSTADLTYSAATNKLLEDVKAVESTGKFMLANEHAYAAFKQEIVVRSLRGDNELASLPDNPTYIPDDIFTTITPVFLIRHPALTVPSIYRMEASLHGHQASDEDFIMLSSFRWLRMLFDHFASKTGKHPLLIDAEDVIYNTKAVMAKLCAAMGIDPAGVILSWAPTPQDKMPDNHIIATAMSTLLKSSQIQKTQENPPAINLEAEAAKWTQEFGTGVGHQLFQIAEAEMENYEHLRQFKISA